MREITAWKPSSPRPERAKELREERRRRNSRTERFLHVNGVRQDGPMHAFRASPAAQSSPKRHWGNQARALPRYRGQSACLVLIAALTVSMWVVADERVGGQTPAFKAARFVDGKPNLNGIWQA